jgi:hypothetical protein
MANICNNKLIVVELKESPEKFARTLERALYGEALPKEHYFSVRVEDGSPTEFWFKTKYGPPVGRICGLSPKHKDATFLLEYWSLESNFQGQVVIKNGASMEHIHREGFGPGFLFADITHPLVDLFWPYLGPRTLAQDAAQRLRDAIGIVRGLKETLENELFTGSRFRAYGNAERTSKVLASLTLMQESMVEHAAGISFDGVLLEYSVLHPEQGDPPDEAQELRPIGRGLPHEVVEKVVPSRGTRARKQKFSKWPNVLELALRGDRRER